MKNLARVLRTLKKKEGTINITVNMHDFKTDEEVDKIAGGLPPEFSTREGKDTGIRWVTCEAEKFDGYRYVDITIFRPNRNDEPKVEPVEVPF